jgi:hypothetical protein
LSPDRTMAWSSTMPTLIMLHLLRHADSLCPTSGWKWPTLES